MKTKGKMEDSLADRLNLRIIKGCGDQCDRWVGFINNSGYGTFKYKKKTILPHREVYFSKNPGISREFHILHKCDNPSCCKVDHLFHGTHSDNMKDMALKKRHRNNRKKECKNGHLFDEVNTYIYNENGLVKRKCRKCQKERDERKK